MTVRCKLCHQPIDVEGIHFQRSPTMDRIIQAAAKEVGARVPDMLSKDRHPTMVTGRQIAMLIARRLRCMSYPEIARSLGMRDHSTPMFHVRKAQERYKSDPEYRARIQRVELDVMTEEKGAA